MPIAGKLSGEQLAKYTQIFCHASKRISNTSESDDLLNEIADTNAGSTADGVEAIFKCEPYHRFALGNFMTVLTLPFPDEVGLGSAAKQYCASYGFLIVISGFGWRGTELCFVDRNAIALNEAIVELSAIAHLKN